MAEKKVRGRFCIKMNEKDPMHEKAICLLEQQPERGKAQLIVNALLYYMNSPAVPDHTAPAMERSAIEVIVREVLTQQQGMDKLHDAAQAEKPDTPLRQTEQGKGGMPIGDTETNSETFSLVADALSAFRGG